MNRFKNRWYLALIGLVTIVLAVIAVATAIRLAQIGRQPIAPTAPTSKPEAWFLEREPAEQCKLAFDVSPLVPPDCYEECETDENCPGDLVCQDVDGTDRCVNPDCPSEQTCVCPLTVCLDLTSAPSTETLEEGSEAQFTCKGSGGTDKPINHAGFRLQIDGGDWQDLGTAPATKTNGEYEGTINYTVPQTGSYRVECRVCTSENSTECTQWGEVE